MNQSVVPARRELAALVGLCALVYLPLAWRYGLWDPWETHYGEIARQMVARGDAITLWWPCSSIDKPWVFHKPVLHFWLMALSLRAFGLEGASAPPDEAAHGWLYEGALRLPNLLLSLATVAMVWHLVRRLASRRAAFLSGLVLATSAQWALVSRQAMTDLPFVAPMTAALACAALALVPTETRAASRRLRLAVPLLLVVVAAPQLVAISLQLRAPVRLGATRVVLHGVVPMLPWLAAFGLALRAAVRATSERALYLLAAWTLCAVATLGKGPAGLGLPAIVIALWLCTQGRARELLSLQLGWGACAFAAVAAPWYHAMAIRHGMPFWNELIGDNYLHRAQGRNGDRGTFEYYLGWLGYALFPWSGLGALGLLGQLQDRNPAREGSLPRREDSPRARLGSFALVWLASELVVLTLVTTKFHHYLLPVLPAAAISIGLFLDELCEAAQPWQRFGLLLVAAPITLLVGRDLAAFPARILWLFNYDYVNMPGTGRPWPSGFDYARPLWALALAATGVTALFLWPRARAAGLWLAVAVAGASTLFLIDHMIPELSPHWSQKHVIASYYEHRRSADEPLVVWELYWRGENLYTRNAIWPSDPRERSAFLPQDQPTQKLAAFLAAHPGRRVFFLVERTRWSSLQAALPLPVRESLRLLDDSNNKLYLAVADN